MEDLNYKKIFEDLPGIYLVLEPNPPHFSILALNTARAVATISDTSVIGKDLFEVFSDNPNNPVATGVPNLNRSLMLVMETKKPHQMELQRYDLFNSSTGKFEERYWLPQNIPVLDEENKIAYIIHAVEDVTDKMQLKQKEEKIEMEVQRLHKEQTKILESVGDGFISIDKNHVVKYWNNRAEQIFHIRRNDIIGKDLCEFINQDKHPEIYERLCSVLDKNEPTYFEGFYEPAKVWIQMSVYPSEYGVSAFIIDVTERKIAEQLLEKSERKFRSIVEHIGDGIASISEDGIVMEISPSGKKILDFPNERLLGKKWEEIILPADLQKARDAMQAIIRHPELQKTIEFRFRISHQDYKWMEGSFYNLLAEETIRAIVLYFRDISEKKQQQEQLIASEEKYRYLFENSPATKLVWTLDDLRIREVNQTAVNNFGYTRDEFLGMTAMDIRPVEEHDRFLSLLVELKNGTEFRNAGVWSYLNKKGSLMFMNVSFHTIEFDNKPAAMVLAMNVTEKILLKKRLNEERKKRQQEITEAVLIAQENERAELGKELHDNINQILTTARLYLEYVLAKKGDQTELVTQSHDYIKKAMNEIKSLSKNLLLPSLEEISLKNAMDDLFKNIKSLNTVNLKFLYSVANEESINSRIRLAIFRITQEQISNILKHSKATEIIITITLDQGQIHLSVEDNGVGFELKKENSGLGLKNIRSRVSLLGGSMNILSQPGLGTELIINFPVE